MNGAQAAPAATVPRSPPPIASSSSLAASAAESAAAAPSRLEPELRRAGDLVYLELVTANANKREKLPLIVAIHGLGDNPESFAGLVNAFDVPARVVLPRGTIPYGDGYSWFEFGNGKDAQRISRGLFDATERLSRAISQIARERPSLGKPIVTGFSQGGMLSFALAALHPDQISAAYPLSGVFPYPLLSKLPDAASYPKIVALHGEADALIPIAETKRGIAGLRAHGIDVTLKTYPGVSHTLSIAMGIDLYGLLKDACRTLHD